MSGFKKSLEVFPAIIVSGVSFAFFQWFTANYIGPMLPDVVAGIASIICLVVLLRYWKPKSIWRFSEEPVQTIDTKLKYSSTQIFRAWSPFIIMTMFIIAWGLQPVKDALNSVGIIKFNVGNLNDAILTADGRPLVIKPFELNYLSAPGTAILFATIISIPLVGMKFREGIRIYWLTLKQLRFPVITIASVVGFAFIANNSGMSITMAMALAATGSLFPFFSPILGWLGVFLTGSDTSSNALFCKLQATTADALGVDPVVTVSANASGGVTGKMISPQSIAIGAAAVGLVGKESELFRFSLKHSFIMLLVIAVITCVQAYLTPWIIPVYEKGVTIAADEAHISTGFMYLMGLAVGLVLIAGAVVATHKKG
jgi:lactate permease